MARCAWRCPTRVGGWLAAVENQVRDEGGGRQQQARTSSQGQQLPETFGFSVLISPGAHRDLNPFEIVWGTVKTALKRGNTIFILHSLNKLVAKEVDKSAPAIGAKYEDHANKMEDFSRGMADARDAVESELQVRERDAEGFYEADVNTDGAATDKSDEYLTGGASDEMEDEEEG